MRPPTRSRASSTIAERPRAIELACRHQPGQPRADDDDVGLERSFPGLRGCRGARWDRGRAGCRCRTSDQPAPADPPVGLGCHLLRLLASVGRTFCKACSVGAARRAPRGLRWHGLGRRAPRGICVSGERCSGRRLGRPPEPGCAGTAAHRSHPAIEALDPRPGAPRVFGMQYKQDARNVVSYASFRRKIDCMLRTYVLPHLARGRPNVVVFNEDIGLAALGVGSRGARCPRAVHRWWLAQLPGPVRVARGPRRRDHRVLRAASRVSASLPIAGRPARGLRRGDRHRRPQLHGNVFDARETLRRVHDRFGRRAPVQAIQDGGGPCRLLGSRSAPAARVGLCGHGSRASTTRC